MTRRLSALPEVLERELFEKFREVERNYRERRWEPSELNGGKLCEVAYSILRGHVDGEFPTRSSKPSNFLDACRDLEKASASFGRSVRILIPRVLVALYEIRNNRNVGHVGGDVDPNPMDALFVLQSSKWIVCELVRLFHGITLAEASHLVDSISERDVPIVWDTGSVRRVLDTGLSMLEKTLVLLYSSSAPMEERALVNSIEHSNASVYRRDVLRKARKERLLEYDCNTGIVKISPLGIRRVEDQILQNNCI